jgi:tripartite-type tricarboxylate transporter receptor subunit TctC
MTLGVAQIKAGRVKAIGITSAEPSKALPDVPGLASIGLGGKDLHISFWHLLLAPKGIPVEAMQKLNMALGKVLEDRKLNADFNAAGVEVFPPAERSPQWAKTFFEAEVARWSDIVMKNNITAPN